MPDGLIPVPTIGDKRWLMILSCGHGEVWDVEPQLSQPRWCYQCPVDSLGYYQPRVVTTSAVVGGRE